jgi:hypothetical protein
MHPFGSEQGCTILNNEFVMRRPEIELTPRSFNGLSELLMAPNMLHILVVA